MFLKYRYLHIIQMHIYTFVEVVNENSGIFAQDDCILKLTINIAFADLHV